MLVLVRHGRTELNSGGRLQGRIDAPLDALGRAQAAAVANVPMVAGAARVVCSPLLRARQTADAFGRPVSVDDRWIELDYGDWDGLPLGEVPRSSWAEWRADVHFRPPAGETLAELGGRVREACVELAAEAAEHDIVVVTHVSPIKAATAWALAVGDDVSWRLFLSPASITVVGTGGPVPSVRVFNDTGHLANLDSG